MAVICLLTRGIFAAGWGSVGRSLRGAALVFCAGMLSWMGYQTVDAAWLITKENLSDPYSAEVGQFARENLPANAVLLCEESQGYEHLTTMFYADRTCYALAWIGSNEMARKIRLAGGIPYFVSYHKLPLNPVYESRNRGPTIYLWETPMPQ